jgi:hypothetical protein
MRATTLATPSPSPTQSEALSLINKPSHSCNSPSIGSITTANNKAIKRSNGFSIANLVFNENSQNVDKDIIERVCNKGMGVLERCEAKNLLSEKISQIDEQLKADLYNKGVVSPVPSRSDIDDDDLSIKVDDDEREHSVSFVFEIRNKKCDESVDRLIPFYVVLINIT